MTVRTGHTGPSVRDRTVTKTRIKLPVVTIWDMSSDSPLHWIPCHSSLNGQIDEFMHNWGLYYEKENEGSLSSLTVKGWWVGGWRKLEGMCGGVDVGEGDRPMFDARNHLDFLTRSNDTPPSPLPISTEAGLRWALGTVSELSPLVYVEN